MQMQTKLSHVTYVPLMKSLDLQWTLNQRQKPEKKIWIRNE